MRLLSLFCLLLVSSAAPLAATPVSPGERSGVPAKGVPLVVNGRLRHAVHLQDPPLALQAFSGSDAHRARSARQRLLQAPEKRRYRELLKQRQLAVLGEVEAALGRRPDVVRAFQLAANALVMDLGAAEAQRLRALPGVRHVEPLRLHFPQTDRGPTHIGAPAAWDGLGLPAGSRGEGVVVGVIDTGINVKHPSFQDVGDDGYDHDNPFGAGIYLGDCLQPEAEKFCNDKLVGVVSFPEITGNFGATAAPFGIDHDGHGSHVASIAAGNVLHDVPAFNELGGEGEHRFASISGVAPHANIVSYQVCHPGNRGCDPSLAVAAVEHAIEHGVDVLNYSIGGSPVSPWFSIDAMAFLSARAAGLHVANSAGNHGPSPQSVTSPGTAPWLTSVAAVTHDRDFGEIRLDGFVGGETTPAAMTGKGVTAGFEGPVVAAADAGDARCLQPFAAGTFAGEIVVCERGENARVEKGANVLAGGAGGMVLINVPDGDDNVVADLHVLPAIHLDAAAGSVLNGWLANGAGHRAAIGATTIGTSAAVADEIGDFSSRGPAFPFADLPAPHLGAPGVAIYGAWVESQPFGGAGPLAPYATLLGTSMASPHVAGAYALLHALRPAWTPAEAQSALMLAGLDTRNAEGETGVLFEQGAGRVDLGRALHAGLVLDVAASDYEAANPFTGGDPSALNIAALAQDECLVECSWGRRLRGVHTASWTASFDGDAGAAVDLEPARFTLAAGATRELTVRLRRTGAGPVSHWMFGNVRLVPDVAGLPELRLPLAAFLTTAIVPQWSVFGVQRNAAEFVIDGLRTRAVDTLAVSARATAPRRHDVELLGDPTPDEPLDNPDGVAAWTLLTLSRAGEVLIAETLAELSDIDLYVGRDADGDGRPSPDELEQELVCASGSPLGFENCVIFGLEPGDYWVMAHSYFGAETAETVSLLTGVVAEPDARLVAGAPASVARGEPYAVALRWRGDLAEGDVLYAVADLRDASTQQAVAGVPVKLTRVRDDVRLVTAHDAVAAGEDVTFTLRIDANSGPRDRDYLLQVDLPKLVDFVSAEDIPRRDGRRLRWQVHQPAGAASRRVSFTVRTHPLHAGSDLTLVAQHSVAQLRAAPMFAQSPPVRLLETRGAGTGLALLPILLAAAALRRKVR